MHVYVCVYSDVYGCVCKCVCVCIYIFRCVWMHVCVWESVEARGWRQRSSSVALHLIYWAGTHLNPELISSTSIVSSLYSGNTVSALREHWHHDLHQHWHGRWGSELCCSHLIGRCYWAVSLPFVTFRKKICLGYRHEWNLVLIWGGRGGAVTIINTSSSALSMFQNQPGFILA